MYYVAGADGCGEHVFSARGPSSKPTRPPTRPPSPPTAGRPPGDAGTSEPVPARRSGLARRAQPLAGDAERSPGPPRPERLALPASARPTSSCFTETVPGAGRGSAWLGVNVTIPHKHAARELASSATRGGPRNRGREHAHASPAGEITAANTDAPGVAGGARCLASAAARPRSSGRAAAPGRSCGRCCTPGAAEVWVWNHAPERAAALAPGARGAVPVERPRPADLLVNCTSSWSWLRRVLASGRSRAPECSRTLGHRPPTTSTKWG